MLRYSVTALMLPEHADEYEAWLREGHMQAVIELGGAVSAELLRLDCIDGRASFQASYLFPSRAAFDAYSAGPAVVLRQDGIKLFAETGKVLEWTRSVGVVKASMPALLSETPSGPKSRWPELVGRDINEALQVIAAERKDVSIFVTQQGDAVSMDFNEGRVRLQVADGVVCKEPRLG